MIWIQSTISSSSNTRYHNQVSLFFDKFTSKTTNYTQGFIVKESDRQNLLNNNSEHPISLKNSIHAACIHTVKF